VSAAYGILSYLKSWRGRDEVGDYYLNMIFYCVRDYRRGTLPRYITDDPEQMNWIRQIAEQLPIDANTKYKDLIASVSPDSAKIFWLRRNKVSNFLKHADRDPDSNIALEEVDNLHLLIQALCSYVDLVSDDLGAEGLVLWMYFCAVSGMKDQLPPKLLSIAVQLEDLDCNDRLNLCSQLLRKMNEIS
jgi:hypothetical protein